MLAGAGYIPAAAIAAGLILTAHLALRPVAQRVDRLPAALEAAVSRLSLEPAVSSVTWTTTEPEPALLAAAEE